MLACPTGSSIGYVWVECAIRATGESSGLGGRDGVAGHADSPMVLSLNSTCPDESGQLTLVSWVNVSVTEFSIAVPCQGSHGRVKLDCPGHGGQSKGGLAVHCSNYTIEVFHKPCTSGPSYMSYEEITHMDNARDTSTSPDGIRLRAHDDGYDADDDDSNDDNDDHGEAHGGGHDNWSPIRKLMARLGISDFAPHMVLLGIISLGFFGAYYWRWRAKRQTSHRRAHALYGDIHLGGSFSGDDALAALDPAEEEDEDSGAGIFSELRSYSQP